MNADDRTAIDIHTHAEASCWNPSGNHGAEHDRAADKTFSSDRRPTIARHRERKIGLVMTLVDSQSPFGRRHIPNAEFSGRGAVALSTSAAGSNAPTRCSGTACASAATTR